MDKCKDKYYLCIMKGENNSCTLDIDTPCNRKIYVDDKSTNTIEFSIQKVYGIDCPPKFLIMNNKTPVIFVNTSTLANDCLSYLSGNIQVDLPKATKNKLNKILK